MGQREQSHSRIEGDPRRFGGRRVLGLPRSHGLVDAEGRLVHEQVGALGRGDDRRGRERCRPLRTSLRPAARGAENLLGRHDGSVRKRDRLAPLERAALGPGRDAEPIGGLDVEAAGPFVLDEGVAERGVPVARPQTRAAGNRRARARRPE